VIERQRLAVHGCREEGASLCHPPLSFVRSENNRGL
jgi:hypothetical protein